MLTHLNEGQGSGPDPVLNGLRLFNEIIALESEKITSGNNVWSCRKYEQYVAIYSTT